MIKRKIALCMALLMMIQAPAVYAEQNTFLEDLNKTIDSAQETLNEVADDIDAATQKVEEVLDDTKEIVDEAVATIKVVLSDLDNHWAKQYIDELINRDVVGGYPDGTFKPNASISVSEFTKILMAGAYEDINYQASSPWYQTYVDAAIDKGIIVPGEFTDYTRPITREEMAIMIARAAENKDKLQITEIQTTKFNDDTQIASGGKKYIMAVSDAGIITGYPDGTFGPDKQATRAEASVMLNRLLDLEKQAPAEEQKTVVEQMIENVLASTMVSPTSLSKIQELVENKDTIFCNGNYIEDNQLKVNDDTYFGSSLDKALKIGQILQPHAEKSNLMVAYTGGSGTAVGVTFGENEQYIRKGSDMFYIGYYRDVEWANEEEINGKVYEYDKCVQIGGGLFAGKRLEDEVGIGYKKDSVEKYDEYRRTHIDIDEDVLNAFYDGLRAVEPARAEKLFEKMIEDYIYAKTHQYGDPNNSLTEFFEIDGQLIYREDIRGSSGRHRYINYEFIK